MVFLQLFQAFVTLSTQVPGSSHEDSGSVGLGGCWAMESVSVSAPGDTDLGSLRYRLDIKFQLCKTNRF